MGRDTEAIERDIENARNQLASTLDELSVRASPKNVMAQTKQTVMEKVNQPNVKYAFAAVGVVLGALVLRKLLR
ncbi:DUF3618 domain-containing protein [Rhodococcus sp. 14C212]|uniref:DUF3618 domain-containing protein n=1 Tax=Rhodococcus sp. 14C212 TaxID=2711209 RepID=UPI0013EAD4A8|nr:DUF3618 domain-containing protein [Rhodococcus sp. 14C212]